MSQENKIDQVFLNKLTEILEENYTNEQFGVQELANGIERSRSQLHRKINNTYKKSTSQFIREFRLEKALEMLQDDIATASEISYKVGFNSPTYFNTAFKDYFGYTPGEVKFRQTKEPEHIEENRLKKANPSINRKVIFSSLSIIIFLFLSYFLYTYFTGNVITRKEDTNIVNDKSIGVLPFKNLSDNNDNQYFADGVMDDILNHLSAIKELKVISRTTMEQYRNTKKTAPEIAKELKVNYILESSIQKYKDSIKIITQLNDARNDKLIWFNSFKSEFKDIFSLESEIAKQIAIELKTTLSPLKIKQIEKVPTKNIIVYNLYLKGKYFFNLSGVENIKKSIQYFEEAIEKDHKFALAYAALAEAYLYLADSERIDLAKINELALTSIRLDSNMATAHSTLGGIACWYEWDWEKSEKEYLRALQINSNSSSAYNNYSYFLFYVKGSYESAREIIDKAKSLDPLSIYAIMRSAEFYLIEGNYKKAMLETQKALELVENYQWAYWVNFECYFRQGENEKAISELVKGWKLDSISNNNVKPLKAAYDKNGINGIYQWIIDYDLRNGDNSDGKLGIGWNNFQLYWVAQKYAFLDNKMEAIKYLEIAYNRKSTSLYHIKYDPYFKNLRTEPRFLAILEKMNLGNYSNDINLLP